MKVTSPAFSHNQTIPRKYTGEEENTNPPLAISGTPEGTKSMALIMDDPDAPGGNWDHWLVYNIVPTSEIKENSVPGMQTRNDFGRINYGGPCPPRARTGIFSNCTHWMPGLPSRGHHPNKSWSRRCRGIFWRRPS